MAILDRGEIQRMEKFVKTIKSDPKNLEEKILAGAAPVNPFPFAKALPDLTRVVSVVLYDSLGAVLATLTPIATAAVAGVSAQVDTVLHSITLAAADLPTIANGKIGFVYIDDTLSLEQRIMRLEMIEAAQGNIV